MCRATFTRSVRLRTDFAEKRDSVVRASAPQPEAASVAASASVRPNNLKNDSNAGALADRSAPATQITRAGPHTEDIAIANPFSVVSSSQSVPRARFTYPGIPTPPPLAVDIMDQQESVPPSLTSVPQPAPRTYDRTRRNGIFLSPETGRALQTATRAGYFDARQVRSRSENINVRGEAIDITALFEEQLRSQRRPLALQTAWDVDDGLCRV